MPLPRAAFLRPHRLPGQERLQINLDVHYGGVQIIYPLSTAEASALEAAGTAAEQLAALDKRLDSLMATVRLQYLVAREGSWGAVSEWEQVLSLGVSPACLGRSGLCTATRPS